jgi:hypothetical protein
MKDAKEKKSFLKTYGAVMYFAALSLFIPLSMQLPYWTGKKISTKDYHYWYEQNKERQIITYSPRGGNVCFETSIVDIDKDGTVDEVYEGCTQKRKTPIRECHRSQLEKGLELFDMNN